MVLLVPWQFPLYYNAKTIITSNYKAMGSLAQGESESWTHWSVLDNLLTIVRSSSIYESSTMDELGL